MVFSPALCFRLREAVLSDGMALIGEEYCDFDSWDVVQRILEGKRGV